MSYESQSGMEDASRAPPTKQQVGEGAHDILHTLTEIRVLSRRGWVSGVLCRDEISMI